MKLMRSLLSRRGSESERQESRLNRHKRVEPDSKHDGVGNLHAEPLRLFVQRSVTGEFVHGREGVTQTGRHLLSVPDQKGVVNAASNGSKEESFDSGTCTPVTSGAEELLDDEQECHETPPDLDFTRKSAGVEGRRAQAFIVELIAKVQCMMMLLRQSVVLKNTLMLCWHRESPS